MVGAYGAVGLPRKRPTPSCPRLHSTGVIERAPTSDGPREVARVERAQVVDPLADADELDR